MKTLKKLLATVLSLGLMLAFTACDKQPSETACEKNGHTYGEWTVETNATCTEKGKQTRTCSVCGDKQTDEIKALGHAYGDFVYAEESNGLIKVKRCSRCNAESERTVVENGIAVHNVAEFKTAIATNNAYVVLMNDIGEDGTADFTVRPSDTDFKLTIDLNEHTIFAMLKVCTTFKQENGKIEDCGKKLDVKVLNGTVGTDNGHISADDENSALIFYGMMVNGIGVKLSVENVKTTGYYGGFYTNGANAGSSIEMSNCTLKGIAGGASYLAGGHAVTFENCSFEGLYGLYIKSGNVTLNACTVTATGEYEAPIFEGNGAEGSGSGIVIDSADYNIKSLVFTMNGGSITSANGYALEQVVTKGDNYSASTLNGVTLTAGKTPAVFETTEGAVTVND